MVVLGRVRAPHGVKGWVKIQPFTQDIEGLLGYAQWWLGREGEWRERVVAEAAVHGATVIARLEGCDDREAAAELRGCEVAVPRTALPDPGAGEFYWNDLMGSEAFNRKGELLGRISQLMDTGANPVLVLQGERERLVPFIEGVVVEVDIARRRLVLDWERDY
jgi:16S rRNA processing protein RimM